MSVINGIYGYDMRVFLEDTDAGGIVYHANHIRFFDRSRTEWLIHYGLDKLINADFIFIVRKATVNYKRPMQYNDMLRVTSVLASYRGTQFVIDHEIIRDGITVATGQIEIACLDKHTMRPVRVPQALIDIFDEQTKNAEALAAQQADAQVLTEA